MSGKRSFVETCKKWNLKTFISKYVRLQNLPIDEYVDAVSLTLSVCRTYIIINLDDCLLLGSNEDTPEGVVCRTGCEEDVVHDIQRQVLFFRKFWNETFGAGRI